MSSSGGTFNRTKDLKFANENRITKLMGESFKLHSQALAGYEDAVASGTVITTPTMSSDDVTLGAEAVY